MSLTRLGLHDCVLADYCGGCLASHPHVCEECQAYLYDLLSFVELPDTTARALGHAKPHTHGLSVSPTSHSRFFPLQPREPISSPDLPTNTSHQCQTVLDGIQSTTVTTDSRLQRSSPVDVPGSRLASPASEDSSTMSGIMPTYDIVPSHTYYSPISLSQVTDASQTRSYSPQADQSRQFRCDHASKRSPGTGCGASFTHKKDLARHVRSVHALEDEPAYRCKCSYKNVRKDNYRRHLLRCTKGHGLRTFRCKCGFACVQKIDHVAHLGRFGGCK